MSKRHYYLMSRLPDLAAFGHMPPMSKQEFLGLVREAEGPWLAIEALLLSEDLLQREAVMAGEIEPDSADPAVLSSGQIRGDEPLPDYLVPQGEAPEEPSEARVPADSLWESYFHHVMVVAGISQTPFLKAWAGFEVALRNTLVRYRAERLKLDPKPYLVARDLGDQGLVPGEILSEWGKAPDLLTAHEYLEKARWAWVTEQENWYSFKDDEVAAYAAKLVILHRWHRIARQAEK